MYIYKRYIEKDFSTHKQFESWTLESENLTLDQAKAKAIELAEHDDHSFGETPFFTAETISAWFEADGKVEILGRIVCATRPLPYYELDYLILCKNVGNHTRWADNI